MHRFLILFALAYLAPSPSLQWSSEVETNLRAALRANYSQFVRPQELTTISLYFQMISLDAIDMKNQVFKVSGWWFMNWNDSRLMWNPSDYDNVEFAQFYEDYVWKPSLVVSNSNNDLSAIDEDTIPIRAKYDGEMIWQPPGLLSMTCEVDSTNFPFDEQTCSLQVTSFGFTLFEVDVDTDEGIKTDYYSENGDWSIRSMNYARTVYYDSGIPYAKVTYSITVKRRSTFHWINIIIPIIVIGALIPLMFLLPPDSGERMGYSLTLLLAYFVLLTLLAAEMPTSAKHTSLLEVYITLVMCKGGFSVFLSIIVLRAHFRDNELHPVPNWLLKATRIGMVICNDPRLPKRNKDPKIHPTAMQNGDTEKTLHPYKLSERKTTTTPVTRIANDNQSDTEVEITWQVVAEIMDAIFLRIFCLLFLLLTFCFLLALGLGDA